MEGMLRGTVTEAKPRRCSIADTPWRSDVVSWRVPPAVSGRMLRSFKKCF